MKHFDVDIDVPAAFDLGIFGPTIVRASTYQNKKLMPHPCGVYFQEVPTDPITGLAAVPYKVADALGCFKVDFLHLHIYDYFSSKEEIKELIKIDPDWTLLAIPSVVDQLFQISKHFDLVNEVKPRSVMEIGDCLALIRPQKRFLMKYYLQDRKKTRREHLYHFDQGDGYAFKKAHAIAYAYVIILQLHLIKGGLKMENEHA